ncbi:MAG: GTPase [Rhodospirillales bacterium]|nr:GTPase [Rhodospirillales bacterium]
MRLKTFAAPTVADAMRQIRAELGEDAVILSTENRGGGVRITAALDPPVAPPAPIADVRQPQRWRPPPIDASDQLPGALSFHGIPPALAARLDPGPSSLAPEALLAARLAETFRFAPLAARLLNNPVMLVGPPGAGKTLAVAKLAARAVIARRPVRVATADTNRAGSIDQLAALCRVMNLRLSVADEPAALARFARQETEPAALTLIDTAGVNPFVGKEAARLAGQIVATQADPVLVIAAGGDAQESIDMAAAFAAIGCARLLVTRLDGARRLGGVLAAAEAGNFSLGEASATPNVAHGLETLNADGLARRILATVGPTRASDMAAAS